MLVDNVACGGAGPEVETRSPPMCSGPGTDNRGEAAIPPTENEARGLYAATKLRTEVRHQLLIGKSKKRAACQQCDVASRALAKILAHAEPSWYRRRSCTSAKSFQTFCIATAVRGFKTICSRSHLIDRLDVFEYLHAKDGVAGYGRMNRTLLNRGPRRPMCLRSSYF